MAESLPPPPSVADLQRIGPEVHVLPRGAVVWRVYFRGGPHPNSWDGFRSYGPTGSRFDHHDPPAAAHPVKAILYGADLGTTCLAEVFQDPRVIDRRRHQPALAAFRLAQDLPLLDVTGAWDPSLAFVLGGAVITMFLGLRLIRFLPRPAFDTRFHLPENRAIDRRLVLGSAVFGAGWGLGGFCPGPAIAALSLGRPEPLVFVAFMLAGMVLHDRRAAPPGTLAA